MEDRIDYEFFDSNGQKVWPAICPANVNDAIVERNRLRENFFDKGIQVYEVTKHYKEVQNENS